jgi:hypothetical protein
VKIHTLPLVKGPWGADLAREPSAVDGTTINFSTLSWGVSSLGQEVHNQARKTRVWFKPEKLGVLLRRCPASAQVLTTWALESVSSGMPHRGQDMSPRDMHLGAASDEAASSGRPEPLAWCLCVLLGCCGPSRPASTAASFHRGISRPTLCRSELPAVLGNLFARAAPSRGPVIEQMPGRGRRLAG